jgi:hypothetical protein
MQYERLVVDAMAPSAPDTTCGPNAFHGPTFERVDQGERDGHDDHPAHRPEHRPAVGEVTLQWLACGGRLARPRDAREGRAASRKDAASAARA